MIGPLPIVFAVMMALLAGSWWARRQFRESQHRTMSAIHTLSERIISAGSATEIAEYLADVLPTITQASSVRLFLHNHPNRSLERVPLDDDPEPIAISVADPQEGLAKAAAKCFSTGSAVHIPDVRTNPLVSVGWTADAPRSAMFVPVATKNECVGVIEVGNRRHLGYFTPEEQAALQHLANQVATSITLQAQQEIREQLFRGEKLAATGQLISAIAGELKAPLDSILELSSALASLPPSERTAADLRQLAAESARASEIVSRLVSFARPEDSSALPVDANAVIGELVRFREPQWKERGLRVTNKISPEPASVLGARGQLEQVFLNILVHAEQSAAAASGKSLSIGTSSMGGRLVVEIQYSSDAPGESVISAEKSGGGGLGLDVCRGIVQSHGGQIRLVTRTGFVGIEIDLPIDESSQPQTRPAARTSNSRNLTLMVVDHDPAAQRQLLALLTARGHRVVPVPSEQAADLSQRMRFDAVLWAIRAGGAKWSDNQGRLRNYVPFFVLISDGYDADLASSLAQSGGRLLSRPVQARDLDDILEAIGSYDPARVPA